MEKKYIAVLVLVLVVLAGVGFQLYQFYKAKNGIKVEGFSSPDISTEGVGPVPTEIHIDFNINVRNMSSYSLEIEELTYNVTVEGRHFAHDSLHDITLPARSTAPVPVSLDFTTMDAIRTLWDYLVGGGFEFRVSGSVDVPFKLFDVVKVSTISITYSESKYLQREGLGGEVKGATDIVLQPPLSRVQGGEVVRFKGRLTTEGGRGIPNQRVRIKDDDTLRPDDLLAAGYTDSSGHFTISWYAEDTDPPLDSTIEVYAEFSGSPQYGKSSSKRYEVEVS